jgi:hypothetical protein
VDTNVGAVRAFIEGKWKGRGCRICGGGQVVAHRGHVHGRRGWLSRRGRARGPGALRILRACRGARRYAVRRADPDRCGGAGPQPPGVPRELPGNDERDSSRQWRRSAGLRLIPSFPANPGEADPCNGASRGLAFLVGSPPKKSRGRRLSMILLYI